MKTNLYRNRLCKYSAVFLFFLNNGVHARSLIIDSEITKSEQSDGSENAHLIIREADQKYNSWELTLPLIEVKKAGKYRIEMVLDESTAEQKIYSSTGEHLSDEEIRKVLQFLEHGFSLPRKSKKSATIAFVKEYVSDRIVDSERLAEPYYLSLQAFTQLPMNEYKLTSTDNHGNTYSCRMSDEGDPVSSECDNLPLKRTKNSIQPLSAYWQGIMDDCEYGGASYWQCLEEAREKGKRLDARTSRLLKRDTSEQLDEDWYSGDNETLSNNTCSYKEAAPCSSTSSKVGIAMGVLTILCGGAATIIQGVLICLNCFYGKGKAVSHLNEMQLKELKKKSPSEQEPSERSPEERQEPENKPKDNTGKWKVQGHLISGAVMDSNLVDGGAGLEPNVVVAPINQRKDEGVEFSVEDHRDNERLLQQAN